MLRDRGRGRGPGKARVGAGLRFSLPGTKKVSEGSTDRALSSRGSERQRWDWPVPVFLCLTGPRLSQGCLRDRQQIRRPAGEEGARQHRQCSVLWQGQPGFREGEAKQHLRS